MNRSKKTLLLVSNLINIRYLTGVEMTFGMLLFGGKKAMKLFVDSRYTEKAKKEAHHTIRVFPIDDLPKYLRKLKRVRFEADDVTVARLNRWKKRYKGVRWIPSEGVIEEMRRVKNNDEIRAIRKACRITDDVMMLIPYLSGVGAPEPVLSLSKGWGAQEQKLLPQKLKLVLIAQGAAARRPYELTEKQLAWHIEKLSRSLGADAMAFDTIVGFGNHTARPHHSPTDRKLKKRDIIQIDMGVKVNGYCSDCSRVFFTGKPTKEQKEIFDLLVKTVKETTKQVKAGAPNRALDSYARSALRRGAPMGRPNLDEFFTHGLGHGVGLEIHEGVSLSKRAPKQKMKANEVITIEPGIYLSGKWGMRIEDTVLVTQRGSRTLTKARK